MIAEFRCVECLFLTIKLFGAYNIECYDLSMFKNPLGVNIISIRLIIFIFSIII